MTKAQIEAVLERVRTWPPERQEDAARVLMAMEAEAASLYRLSAEERADIEAALAEIARGEVASDAEVAAVFDAARFDRKIERDAKAVKLDKLAGEAVVGYGKRRERKRASSTTV